MELSPRIYHWFVRPKWFPKMFVEHILRGQFDFDGKTVLDFGSGVGSSCPLFNPGRYRGLDCDQSRVEYAKRIHPEYDFDVVEGTQLPIESNSMDYVLIVSVLHHIPEGQLHGYLEEFHRVLKPFGKVIAIEPCFFNHCHFNNAFMEIFDKGEYIRDELEYVETFHDHNYQVEVVDRYKQMFFYNKLFFIAQPQATLH